MGLYAFVIVERPLNLSLAQTLSAIPIGRRPACPLKKAGKDRKSGWRRRLHPRPAPAGQAFAGIPFLISPPSRVLSKIRDSASAGTAPGLKAGISRKSSAPGAAPGAEAPSPSGGGRKIRETMHGFSGEQRPARWDFRGYGNESHTRSEPRPAVRPAHIPPRRFPPFEDRGSS